MSTTSPARPDRARGRDATASLSRLFDRLPPNSVDAERSLLGSLLLDPSLVSDIIHVVSKPEHFYKEAHGAIFKALVETYDRHQSGDLVQLAEALRSRGVLDRVGGADYLMELAEAVPSAVNAPHYARLVAQTARLRRLIDTAGEIIHDAYHAEGADLDGGKAIVDAAEQAIFDIAQEDETAEPERLEELLHQELDRIEQAEGRGVSGLATGFDDLDRMLSGMQEGELIILAARPSMGKTAMALNLAEQIAFGGRTPWSPRTSTKPVPVGFFSLEMSRGALAQRLLSARSGVDAQKLRTGQVGMEDWQRLQRACGELAEAPLYIDDTPGMTVLSLRAKARRMRQKYGVRAIVIDYLQLLTAPGSARESRQVEVSAISRGIKALARELKVPVLCLAQLNRGAEQREGNRPRMSDLRESGSIEQDADVVMLLHREAYYHKDDEEWLNDPANEDKLNLAELIIAKQRNGPTGVAKLTWDDGITRFKSRDDWHRDDGFPGGAAPTPSDPTPPPSHGGGYTFAPGSRSGPETDFRDGGGPDRDDEEPPF